MKRFSILAATFVVFSATSAAAGQVEESSADVLARAGVAFHGQAELRTNPNRPASKNWFTEDAIYEYSAPAQALTLSWLGRPAVQQHLQRRAIENDGIDLATLRLFPTLERDTVFAQYQTSGVQAHPVIAIVEMRGSEIAKIREFARPETIADALAAARRTTNDLYSKAK
jgi:hypothetical protein